MKDKILILVLVLAIVLSFVSCEQKIPEMPTLESTSATVKGTLDLPRNGNVSGSDVWIKVVCNGETRNISRANSDGTFSVSGLRETESYDILFSTVKPETSNEKSMSKDVSESSTNGYGGWLSNVTAAINEGNDVGSVSIKPLGTIKGNVKLDGETEHYDILVYIPGTSFSAFTNENGDFSLYNVPEATYTLRATSLKSVFDSAMSESVTVRGSKTNEDEHPVVQLDDIVLYRNTGTVEGTILLDSQDDATGTTVMIRDSEGKRTYTSSTDNDGRFHIDDVKSGTYTLYASKAGFDTAIVEDVVVLPAATKMIPVQTLSSGVRYVNGKVTLEGRTDHSGALITATNTRETSLLYSAISNEDGDYSLVNMKPGEYRVVITMNNYSTHTVGVVNVLKDTAITLDSVELMIIRGTISGTVKLEGRSSNKDTKVELMKGTDVYEVTYTDESGSYAFFVPQGNYSGVRYGKTDFESTSVSRSIALFADNYVSMGDSILRATHNIIHGKVDVLTTDDESEVTIGFDGEVSINPFVTTPTGEFLFEHVPLGDYVMRFKREDCSDITVPVKVIASDGIELSTITLTPNTATITGKVTLKDALSSDGVRVSVDMGEGRVLETYTDMSGHYELGGVSIADAYTIQYSKEGWIGTSQAMAPKLDALERRELPEVAMTDTTAPVLKSVTINNGSNTTADKNVVVHIDAEDLGSGCKTVIISDFNSSGNISYANVVDWMLEGVNGEKTVYVKVLDRAGNESNTITATITLTDQKTEVKGVLKGDNLAWTKERSPYLVTGNLPVEKDDVLKIEPGVDVQFEGDYYLQVEGKLEAKGTVDERISFYGIGAGEDNWYGMKFVNDNDSVISHANVSGLKKGISGYCDIDHSEITANGWAVGSYASYDDKYCLSGNLIYSIINGNASVRNGFVTSNEIHGTTIYLHSANVDGNTFEGTSLKTSYCFVYNNDVSTTNVASVQDIQKYVTYNNCELQIGFENHSSDMRASELSLIQFNNCTFSKLAASVNGSNFINCGAITITTDIKVLSEFDLTGNYWGELNTSELGSKGDDSNMSFINDYYDDFNLSKVLYSDWKESAVSDAGYQGEGFGRDELTTTVYSIGDTGPAGGLVFYDKGFYSDGWRYLETVPSDLEERYVFGYYRPGNIILIVGTIKSIGSGRYNTERLVKCIDIDGKAYSDDSGEAVKEYAARKCLDYEYGGYEDWFLPSKDELNLMYENLHRKGLGSFAGDYYWSSSEYAADSAWFQYFSSGSQGGYYRNVECRVRPVRAF